MDGNVVPIVDEDKRFPFFALMESGGEAVAQ
jgi:hypothetical protein